jgi:hypothetical protein
MIHIQKVSDIIKFATIAAIVLTLRKPDQPAETNTIENDLAVQQMR